jgi:TPR repeat protein
MKLVPLFLLAGMLAVSGCSKKAPTFSPELVSKAEAGDARAQNDLGRCYYKALGVAQDYNEAVKWYTKAAEQGNSEAEQGLGY